MRKAKQNRRYKNWNGTSTKINELKEYIQKVEPRLIEYQEQIQRLVNELNQTKQNEG